MNEIKYEHKHLSQTVLEYAILQYMRFLLKLELQDEYPDII